MMRVLEFIVALIIVAVVGVVVGVIMPGSGHVERSLVFGKDMRQVYDILDNYRRFEDYSSLRQDDPQIQYKLSGNAYGPGAQISWNSDKIGDGTLTIASAEPDFYKIDNTVNSAKIIWNLDNGWRGQDKHFTLDLERQGSRHQLTKVTWSYDVAYGFNLVNRYSNLYIHGAPDSLIQSSLGNLQNVLAAVPNIDYGTLVPYIRPTQPTPMLLVPTSIQRSGGLAALDETTAAAVKQIQDTAKKLGVNVVGPRVIFTTSYGDQTYAFDVGMPIDATSLTVAGQSQELTAPQPPKLGEEAPAEASSAPASASSTAADAKPAGPQPGDHDRFGRLIVGGNVRATLAFGEPSLVGVWNGTGAGVPLTRDMLKAYAQTHGYKFDEVTNRLYDIEVQPETKDKDGNVTTYAKFEVFLPLIGDNVPEQTPEQAAGIPQPTLEPAPASSASAPAAAGSAAAASSSEAPAEAASAGE
ncbi:polyketide cyclase [Frateuria sp. STR12]|uniref:polyketide cyclase n=1 Tax=Frateuria hangzhouensis TaxID=2995589 RepID=UPI002260EB4D|nr:polyketide cyclase [Frateuria sp. STR12]MCX7513585.1 polyketide cyclase [Frateuria sp. STR12]